MKQRKYTYLRVIQQRYATRWEDVEEFETDSTGWTEDWPNIQYLKKEYRRMGYPTREISRRVRNERV